MKTFLLAVCILFLSAAAANAELLGRWEFNEGSGTTTSNLANPGVGDALLCRPDGSGGFTSLSNLWASVYGRDCIHLFQENYEFANVQADFTNITSNALTISAWVRREGGNMQAEPIFGKSPVHYGMTIYDGASDVYAYIGSSNKGVSGAAAPYEWTHIAMTFDGNVSGTDNLFIYVNGVAAASKELTNEIPDTAGLDFHIGGNRVDDLTHTYWNTAYFNGYVDDVRLYNHALSAAEIAELAVPEPACPALLYACGACLALFIGRRK